MTGHRLRRRNIELIGCIAKHFLNGLNLGDITDVRAGAMNIDVVDVLGLQTSILECTLHHELCTQAFGMAGRDVIGIAAKAFANHLGIDLCTAGFGMLEFFENKAASALGHDETIARSAERTAGPCGIVVACGQGIHGIEATHATHADSTLGTSSKDGVGLTQTNQVEGIGQCIARRSASAGRSKVRSVETKVDGDVSGSDVANHLGNEEGRELWSVLLMLAVVDDFVLEGTNTANAYTIDNTDAVLINSLQVHTAILHSLNGRDHGNLRITVDLA